MDFAFSLPGFEKRALAVRLRWAKAAILIADGVEQRPTKRTAYSLADDSGRTRQVLLKPTLFDAVPSVQLDDEKPRAIVPRLAWYEYVWLGIPFALIAVGGALGGLFGALGVATNSRLFRTQQDPLARYGLTAVVSISTVLAYLVGATLFQMAISGTK